MSRVGAEIHRLLDRYITVFASREPAAITALHSPGSTYWLRLDKPPAISRNAVEREFEALFAQYPDLRCEVRDVRTGDSFWVLDWVMDFQGSRGRVRFDCLDLVDVDGDGLVDRKVTFVDLAQAQARILSDSRGG